MGSVRRLWETAVGRVKRRYSLLTAPRGAIVLFSATNLIVGEPWSPGR